MRYSPYRWLRPSKASLQMTMQLLCRHPAVWVASPRLLPRTGLNRHGPDTAMNEVHKHAAWGSRKAAAAVAVAPNPQLPKPSESYWRDTWRRPSSALFPGCCCRVGVSCWNSGKACVLLPGEIRKRGITAGLMTVKFDLNQFQIRSRWKLITLARAPGCLTS